VHFLALSVGTQVSEELGLLVKVVNSGIVTGSKGWHWRVELEAKEDMLWKIVDERNQRVTGMEHKLAMLEVECATFNQELQESQAHQRREQKWPNEEAVQTAQVW
jgi:hypothetical protein